MVLFRLMAKHVAAHALAAWRLFMPKPFSHGFGSGRRT